MRTREIFIVENLEEAVKEGLVYVEEITWDRRRLVCRIPFQLSVNGRNMIYSQGERIKV